MEGSMRDKKKSVKKSIGHIDILASCTETWYNMICQNMPICEHDSDNQLLGSQPPKEKELKRLMDKEEYF